MGKIGRTYPRHDLGPAFVIPDAPGRLIFARRDVAQRLPGILAWLCGLVCLALTEERLGELGLPRHYRRVLAAMHGPSEVAAIRAAVGCDARSLAAWLDELDTLGFVQTAHAAAAYYLKAA